MLPSIERIERLSDASLAALRAAFARHGFGEDTIAAADAIAAAAPGGVRLPIARHDLRRRAEPADLLALLFSYAGRVGRAGVESLLGADLVRDLLDAGLLVGEGDAELRSEFRMLPCPGFWVLSDTILDEAESVMPPGPTTAILERILPERIAGSVIDVGCGPGSLALLAAARGAARVLGTDVNPRAIAMARFNARWNGLAAEFRTGDLLEPAGRERFDLLVSQPPYIARPSGVAEVTFLHGGSRGDALVLRLLKTMAKSLTEDGEGLVLCDVPLGGDGDMGAYLRDQVGAEDLHLLALHVAGPDAETHALLYTQLGSTETGPGYVSEVIEQRAHLGALGIEKFRHTLFVARRPGPARREVWRTAVGVREIAAATPEVRARLWEAIRSAGEPDEALLARRVRVAPDAQWVSLRREPEGEQGEHRVRFGPGWPGLEQIVTDEGIVLASLLQQSPHVEAAIAGYAERCDATPAEVRAPLLAYIRRNLLTGMFVPEENGHGR